MTVPTVSKADMSFQVVHKGSSVLQLQANLVGHQGSKVKRMTFWTQTCFRFCLGLPVLKKYGWC